MVCYYHHSPFLGPFITPKINPLPLRCHSQFSSTSPRQPLPDLAISCKWNHIGSAFETHFIPDSRRVGCCYWFPWKVCVGTWTNTWNLPVTIYENRNQLSLLKGVWESTQAVEAAHWWGVSQPSESRHILSNFSVTDPSSYLYSIAH